MARSFPKLKRIAQKTSVHCGPATIAMLASFLGKNLSQDAVFKKTGVGITWFRKNGLSVSDLARAVKKLLPDYKFWCKKNSSLGDVSKIVNFYKYPVGIEWQGVFDWPHEDNDDSEYGHFEDEDPGHYSVVTWIDTKKGELKIADPERHYAGRDRKFKTTFFRKRWWDVNQVKSKTTNKVRNVRDDRMMFIIAKRQEDFPQKIGMYEY